MDTKNQSAKFVERSNCISCGSTKLQKLSGGLYSEDPVNLFISNDPWGENPLPYINDSRWQFVCCEECGQKFHKFILTPEWMNKCYSEWVSNEAIQEFIKIHKKEGWKFDVGKNNTLHYLRMEKMTRNFRNNEAPRILDYGCGYGDFLSVCDGFGAVTCGIDFSPDRRLHGKIPIFPSLEEMEQSSKFRDKFHIITMFEVLEHLPSPLEKLQVLKNHLLPGGLLVLTTPDCKKVHSIITPSDYRLINPLSHINGFSGETLEKIAVKAGFTPVSPVAAHVTADPIKVVKTEVRRIIGRFLPKTTRQYFTN